MRYVPAISPVGVVSGTPSCTRIARPLQHGFLAQTPVPHLLHVRARGIFQCGRAHRYLARSDLALVAQNSGRPRPERSGRFRLHRHLNSASHGTVHATPRFPSRPLVTGVNIGPAAPPNDACQSQNQGSQWLRRSPRIAVLGNSSTASPVGAGLLNDLSGGRRSIQQAVCRKFGGSYFFRLAVEWLGPRRTRSRACSGTLA